MTTLRRSILAEVADAQRPVSLRSLTSGTYGSDRYSAIRALVDTGALVMSWDRRGSSFVEVAR